MTYILLERWGLGEERILIGGKMERAEVGSCERGEGKMHECGWSSSAHVKYISSGVMYQDHLKIRFDIKTGASQSVVTEYPESEQCYS